LLPHKAVLLPLAVVLLLLQAVASLHLHLLDQLELAVLHLLEALHPNLSPSQLHLLVQPGKLVNKRPLLGPTLLPTSLAKFN
jgi:hypothetical protein